MDCSHTCAEELLAFIFDGETLSFEAQQHIKDCSCCRTRVSSYQSTTSFLRHAYRHECPSAVTLSYYCLPNALSVEERGQVAEHLEQCPLCVAELRETSQFLGH